MCLLQNQTQQHQQTAAQTQTQTQTQTQQAPSQQTSAQTNGTAGTNTGASIQHGQDQGPPNKKPRTSGTSVLQTEYQVRKLFYSCAQMHLYQWRIYNSSLYSTLARGSVTRATCKAPPSRKALWDTLRHLSTSRTDTENRKHKHKYFNQMLHAYNQPSGYWTGILSCLLSRNIHPQKHKTTVYPPVTHLVFPQSSTDAPFNWSTRAQPFSTRLKFQSHNSPFPRTTKRSSSISSLLDQMLAGPTESATKMLSGQSYRRRPETRDNGSLKVTSL